METQFDPRREIQVIWVMLGFMVVGCAFMAWSVASAFAGPVMWTIAVAVGAPAAVFAFYLSSFRSSLRRMGSTASSQGQRSLMRLMAAAAFYVGAVGLAVGEAIGRVPGGH